MKTFMHGHTTEDADNVLVSISISIVDVPVFSLSTVYLLLQRTLRQCPRHCVVLLNHVLPCLQADTNNSR